MQQIAIDVLLKLVALILITLRTDKLTGTKAKQPASVTAVDADGKNIRSVEFEAKQNLLTFKTRKNEFAYKIVLNLLSR